MRQLALIETSRRATRDEVPGDILFELCRNSPYLPVEKREALAEMVVTQQWAELRKALQCKDVSPEALESMDPLGETSRFRDMVFAMFAQSRWAPKMSPERAEEVIKVLHSASSSVEELKEAALCILTNSQLLDEMTCSRCANAIVDNRYDKLLLPDHFDINEELLKDEGPDKGHSKGLSKGAGKGPGKGMGKAGNKGQGSSLPSDSQVLDQATKWTVKGEAQELPGDAFAAAFEPLGLPTELLPLTRERFMKLKNWQKTMALSRLAEKPSFVYNFPHHEVEPLDIADVPWSTCVGVQRSGDGSEGVLFVELPGKMAVVVKAPEKVAAEMYGTKLCQQLKIPCPDMRMVPSGSEEGRALKTALLEFDSKRPVSERKVAGMLDSKPGFLVIEYLKARELSSILRFPNPEDPTVECPEVVAWCNATFGLPTSELSEHGCDCLRTMGKLIAFDMLINNYDRLPCIWQNVGNPGNIMFRKDDNSVISIDNMLTCISNQPGNGLLYREYMAKVRSTTFAVLRQPERAHEAFNKVLMFLKEGCKKGHGWPGLDIDVGDAGVRHVQEGFSQIVRAVATGMGTRDNCPLTQQMLSEMQHELFRDLYDGLPKDQCVPAGFEAINVEFMGQVLAIFTQANEQAGASVDAELSSPIPDLQMTMRSFSRKGSVDTMRASSGEDLPICIDDVQHAHSVICNLFNVCKLKKQFIAAIRAK